jgi:hypothetical protein
MEASGSKWADALPAFLRAPGAIDMTGNRWGDVS